ncbi:Peroxiredoxin [Chitinophaga filiformis]|uniref:Peroxiredoxin n=2 Tax=Chitinophaga filiformis TaxID=104663 RepID=A0A1G8B8D3_CHIFI|nr:Peroxiredoxin [Chitinophaga filiformis]
MKCIDIAMQAKFLLRTGPGNGLFIYKTAFTLKCNMVLNYNCGLINCSNSFILVGSIYVMINSRKSTRQALLYMLMLYSISLHAQDKPVSGFTISGNISGTKDGSQVRLVDIEQQKIIDSSITQNGAFILKGHVAEPTTCWIECNNEYATIQVENTVMTFSSPLKDMKLHSTTRGGREQSLQNELNNLQRRYESIYTYAYDSLKNKLYSSAKQKEHLMKVFNEAQDTYMNIYVAFGLKHIDSYLGLDIIFRNRQKISKDSILLLYNSLPEMLKGTDRARALKIYASENLARKGERFLDFEVCSIDGKPFKLSDIKGKYIYLAFGSFSCGPCRKENRELAKIYGTLGKQLDIVNFSLDVNRNEWETAAKKDGVVWHSVSDMMGMTGKIKTLYDVQGMPTSFLIDPAGVIVERFDGYHEDTIEKITSIVTKKKAIMVQY